MRLLLLVIVIAARVQAASPDEGRQQALLQLLKNDCGACHGLNLSGGLGPALSAQSLAGKDDGVLVQTILNGRAGTPMPPWRDFISADEAVWMVQYMRGNAGNKHSSP